MAHFKDLTGERFGRWSVVGLTRRSYRDESGRKFNTLWLCRCDCGVEANVTVNNLTSGTSRSCGCLWLEHITKHGFYDHYLYSIWTGIWQRCFNPSHVHYDRYGGRGVTMKVEWINDPTRFILDVIEEIGERPSDSHTIDRVNNDANYTTGNIRWGTWIDQANNRSNTVWLTYGGVTLSLTLMCEKLDMDHMTVGQRIRKGWTIERALSTPTKFGFHRKEREKQC